MRCSALPLATKCRGSYLLTQGYGSEQSRLGSAFHEAARNKVLKQPIDKDSLRARYGLTDEELRSIDYGIYNITIQIPEGAMILADDKKMSCYFGLSNQEKVQLEHLLSIKELSPKENDELQELLKKAHPLSGTPDFGIYHKEVVTVVDWKSGWGDVEDPETNNQVIGYGILMVEELEKTGKIVKKIHLVIVMPRLNQVKAFVFTRDQLMARAKDIEQIIDEAEKGAEEFTTGPWCQSCFKSMNCPAFAGQIKTLATFVEPQDLTDPKAIEKSLRTLLPFAKSVKTISDKIQNLARVWVDKNGPLELGGGQTYAKVIENKLEVNAKKAFETMKEYFSEESIWEIMGVSMTKVSALAVATKRGLSTVVKNRMKETGALTGTVGVSYRIIKGKGGAENGEGSEG
jgi:hypothetical protein